jgi:hypothetical protein
MKKKNAMIEALSRVWPTKHRQFQEMSALAATGQLGGAQMCELDEHIGKCESCREFLHSVAQIGVQAMPILVERHSPEVQAVPPAGIRARFLSRIEAEQLKNMVESAPRSPVLATKPSAGPVADKNSRRSLGLLRYASALAACLVIGAIGFYAGQWKGTERPPQASQTHSALPVVSSSNAGTNDVDPVPQLQQQKTALETQLTKTKERLSAAESDQEVLGKKLTDASTKLTTLTQQAQSQQQQFSQQSDQAKNQITGLIAEVERLRWQLDESKKKLIAQQREGEDLKAKLEETESDLQRGMDVKSARSEIGDLVAARNLHIIDVYDADNKGTRQSAFGRVFYIEGKSLVFYAYDLADSRRLNASVVFHVWGERAGVKETTHRLGILHNDDVNQSRWAMTFDDPKVLSQINSVFVTAESASKRYDSPHGKKVLFAFFGSPPNHP